MTYDEAGGRNKRDISVDSVLDGAMPFCDRLFAFFFVVFARVKGVVVPTPLYLGRFCDI